MGEAPLETPRPWWKLYLLTWVMVLLVCGPLVLENVMGDRSSSHPLLRSVFIQFYAVSQSPSISAEHGWPLVYCQRADFYVVQTDSYPDGVVFEGSRWPFDKAQVMSFRPMYLVFNILFAILILLATAFTTESYLRRQAEWHQFSIQFILALTAFVALILANYKYDLVRRKSDYLLEYIPYIILCYGCWCVFWAVWRLVAWELGRMAEGLKDG